MQNNNEAELKHLRWQCRRGMLELDLLLLPYLEKNFNHWSLEDKQLFAELLKTPDQELYSWLIGSQTSQPAFKDLIQNIIRSR